MAKTILIRGGAIITMDALGDISRGDILIEDDKIKEISLNIDVKADEVIDGQGYIIVPGFINAHMHTWQTALRALASNWTLLEYFQKMHSGLAKVFEPEDLYIATYMGALNQINCGTTTLVDWCHNNKSPEHNDAAISGLLESGIRSAFFHGTPKPEPKPGETPFWEMPHPKGELLRLMKNYESNHLLTIGCAILGPHYSTLDVALHDFAMAKDLGIVASMHQGGGPARTPEGWQILESQGLLGPHINIVHGHALSDEQLKRFCDLGMSFSATAENEMTQGHGHPLTGRLRALGKAPSLGVDLESVCGGEMFIQARVALGIQRSLDNYAYRELHGSIPPTSTITTREALSWVTIEGAKMLGQADRIGSLAIGKQADLVMIRATDINMQPVNDLVSSVVMQTSLANIENVMIAGSWQKRRGELLAQNVLQKTQDLNLSAKKIKQALGL
ncbi:amidohydrolase family protein [Polynucleobacter kasalickyi]|uniref:Cytosine/adenosine deaminase n=1 Tax=Polynucleobacter kasalickyi TaxID=1938817 RepID=A0A1W2C880_9BURK|nr:amidohydrolase family protein [Polynucleobacter kasalickyi]SMC81399.1 Cytosine/adenosine deaminase [Polynucleobacter kasalickyi]